MYELPPVKILIEQVRFAHHTIFTATPDRDTFLICVIFMELQNITNSSFGGVEPKIIIRTFKEHFVQ